MRTRVTNPIDEAMVAVGALRARRSARRTKNVDRFDVFYQAYIAALSAGAGLLIMSGWIGDTALTGSPASLASGGRAWLGVVSAAAIGTGLRSGSRGGPVAVEDADVRHVLLAPVPIREAMRLPALRQLRSLVFVAAAVGAVAGQLAAHRLPGDVLAWMVGGSGWAVTTTVAAVGAGWVAAGLRIPTWQATLGAVVLVSWSALAANTGTGPSPTGVFGAVGVLALHFDPIAVVAALLLALLIAGAGLVVIGGISLERLSRRSALIGQLRFAATMRDLRTVMVLRRQLNQERPRSRPWLRPRRRGGRTVVVLRDWRALLRTPLIRLLRLCGLVGAAAAAGAGVWQGTTGLLVVAGMCSFLAGLDALEPLAQEIDHGPLVGLAAVPRGAVLARHLIVPGALLLALGLVFGVALVPFVPSPVFGVVLVTAVAAPLAGVAGAAISVLRDGEGPGAQAIDQLMLPPEAVGMRLLYRMALPPAVAVAGFAPVLTARQAVSAGTDPFAAAAATALLVALVAGAVVVWVRYHDDWRDRLAEASAKSTST